MVFLHLDTKYLIIYVQFGKDEYCNLILVVQLSSQKKSLISGSVHWERIRYPDPQRTDPTDRQRGLYSTLCCLKKKHTAQERESPQEKVHSNALEDSSEEERIKQKEDFKTKTDRTKETGFFLVRKNSEHETHIEAELRFFSFFFLDFVSNKMSYVRIIICIIYNIQCFKKAEKIPLTNNTGV